eukprot:scaffold18781_cov103-Isochrysis_galbana.AAC.5
MVRKGKKKSASQENPAEDTADSAAGQPGLAWPRAGGGHQQRGGDQQRAAGSGTGAGAAANGQRPAGRQLYSAAGKARARAAGDGRTS